MNSPGAGSSSISIALPTPTELFVDSLSAFGEAQPHASARQMRAAAIIVADTMRLAVITRIPFDEDRFSPVKPASEQGDYEKDDDDAPEHWVAE